MNNFEILNLLEETYGDIPTIARTQLLDIFELYNLDLNQIDLSQKPIRKLNTFFKQLSLKGVRNTDHKILERALSNGTLFEHEINEYLFNNDEESPFSPLHMGFEELDGILPVCTEGLDNQKTESEDGSQSTSEKASTKLKRTKTCNRGLN